MRTPLKTARYRGISQIWLGLRVRKVAAEAPFHAPVSRVKVVISEGFICRFRLLYVQWLGPRPSDRSPARRHSVGLLCRERQADPDHGCYQWHWVGGGTAIASLPAEQRVQVSAHDGCQASDERIWQRVRAGSSHESPGVTAGAAVASAPGGTATLVSGALPSQY